MAGDGGGGRGDEEGVFVQVRRNLSGLTADVGLLVEVCRRLRGEGRMAGRGRLPEGFGRSSPSGG